METDAATEGKKTRKVKKQVRKGDLPISTGTSSIDQQTKEAWTERENAMTMEDKLVADTDEKKNELEAFIYELRDKIDTTYSEFASEEEKEKIRAKLSSTEVSSISPSETVALEILMIMCRTGSTKRVRTPPRLSTLRRWTRSVSWLVLLSSATWTRSRLNDRPSSRPRRKKLPRSAPRRRPSARRRRRPRRLLRLSPRPLTRR